MDNLLLLALGGLGLALVLLAGLYTVWLICYLTGRLRELQAEANGLRAERSALVEEIAKLELRLQVTYVENARLSAKKDASQSAHRRRSEPAHVPGTT